MLNKDDLRKLSLKQLEKFATGVEGEELQMVNEVIEEKKSVGTATPVGNIENDPKVAEALKKAELVEQKKKEALELKEKKAAEKEALAEKKKLEMQEKVEKKKKEAEERRVALEEKIKEKAAEKAAKLEKREADRKAKEEAAMAKKKELEEQKQKYLENLGEVPIDSAMSKTDKIKQCMFRGMNNDQIQAVTGLERKLICDTTWRLERQVSYWAQKDEYDKAIEAKKLKEENQPKPESKEEVSTDTAE